MLIDFRLIPLQCPNCGAPLEAEECSLVFYCLHCQKSYESGGEEKKFNAYPLYFASPKSTGNAHESPPLYLPFWIIESQIQVMRHQYTRLNPELEYWRSLYSQLKNFLPETNHQKAGEGQPINLRLFVPAFATTNIAAYTTNLGVALTRARPTFESLPTAPPAAKGGPVRPLPCIYSAQEALTLADIIFLALETRETANLIRLEFNLKPLRQELWALPFYLQEQFLIEPKTGVQMLTAGLEGEKKG